MTSTPSFIQPTITRLADRRRFRHSLAGLLGAAAITASAVSLAPAASAATIDTEHSQPVTIRDHYYWGQNTTEVTIVDESAASLYPDPVSISGAQGIVTDVDVEIDGLSHGYAQDLDVLLVGPAGQRALIMSDDGGSSPLSEVDLVLDDEASAPIPPSSQIGSGSYRPGNNTASDGGDPDDFPAPAPDVTGAGSALSVFDGTNPNGVWQLFVVDDDSIIAGSFSAWSITVETADGTTPYPAGATISGATGTVTDVDLTLHGFRHEYPRDLDILLVGPAGQRALVMSDTGTAWETTGLDLVLDDEADIALTDDVKLTSRAYRPSNLDADDLPLPAPAPGIEGVGSALSVFDGTDPNGTWQLFVADDQSEDQGALDGGWSLHVTTTDPAPQTPGATTTATTSGVPGTSSAADTSHPKVSAHTPRSGSKGVQRGAVVKATLSEKVRKSTVSSATAKLLRKGSTKAVAAAVRYDAVTGTITVDPVAKLRAATTYKVVITTGVRDFAGNALDQKPAITGLQKAVWTFSTR